jgi:peptidoglycan/xylan/chitin deacetylase (PgdA/CDA1 family)
MARQRIRTGLAITAHWSGVEWLFTGLTGRRRQPVVVGYHRVVDDYAAHATYSIPPMLISRAMLERHLDWFARRFRLVTLDELRSQGDRYSRSERPLAAITFDDGYRDVYEQAFPVLKRKGIPATVFVVTDFVGTSRVLLHDKLYLLLQRAFAGKRSFSLELPRLLRRLDLELSDHARMAAGKGVLAALRILVTAFPQIHVQRFIDALERDNPLEAIPDGLRTLSWEMLAEMSRAGIVVGSHTKTHAVLTKEDQRTALNELAGSRELLEQVLEQPVTCFAYPDGSFDAAAVEIVAAAGYRIAVTTCQHRDPDHPLLTVPRAVLWERSSVDADGRFSAAVLSCQLSGAFDVISRCGQFHGRHHLDSR